MKITRMILSNSIFMFFFFQAEDGIRDYKVTGVQTCALPISKIKAQVPKPILRKDFIFEEYQVYEARAFGADALLLMANVLDRDAMRRLFDLSRELGMDVLFEAHTKEEIESIPEGARLYGINSRKFVASAERFANSVKG